MKSSSTGLSTEDQKHLRLLSIFHYIVAGIQGLFSLFPLIHFTMGAYMFFSPQTFCPAGSLSKCPPPFIGLLLMIVGGIFVLLGLTLALGIALNGRFIARHQHWLTCIIIAGLECMLFPFGTVLGVFTIIVLNKPHVKAVFQHEADKPS